MQGTSNILYILGDKEIDKIQILKGLNVNDNKEYIIDTKYYSANINIETIDLNKENSLVKLNHNDNVSAIVLVFDSSKPESFNLIKSYTTNNKKIETYNDNDDDDDDDYDKEEELDTNEILYILVDINKSKNEMEDQIEEWCIQHLIEWVIFDSNSHKEYDMRKSDLAEIDEKVKYGIERLIEILESNMWPNMELKKNNSLKKPQEKNEIKEDDDDEYPSIKNDKFLQDSLKKVEGFFKKSATSSQNNSNTNNNNKEETKVKTNGLSIEEDQDEIDDENDDSVMMENTFKELQSIREHMKNLPDEQRRDMAAKIAMMFASSLNFEDDLKKKK
ncbi:hypothetical protein ACTFIU_000526 [Dictyostelium citrinum]